MQKSRTFEAIRTIAGMYLRADVAALSECIAAFGLDTLLYTKVRAQPRAGDPAGSNEGEARSVPRRAPPSVHDLRSSPDPRRRN